MAIITPRLMVVEEVTTMRSAQYPNYANNSSQRVNLILLDRARSLEFENAFLKGQERNLGRMLDFARRYEITSLDGAVTRMEHKKDHSFNSTEKYSLGDVITEKEAFDFGYKEPHVETLCVKIGKLAQEKGASQDSDELTPALIAEGLINQNHKALLSGGVLDIYHKSREKEFKLQKVNEKTKADHPIIVRLLIAENGVIRAACSFFHEETRTIYEFMTTIPQ